MAKKKIEAERPISDAGSNETSGSISNNAPTEKSTAAVPIGTESLLDHIQQQDAAIADLTRRSGELEGTLKELLTYLQKQQGIQTTEEQEPQQQSRQGGGMLDTIGGILQTVMKQNQSEAPTLAQQLAEIQIDNMRLMNQYLIKRVIGDEIPAKIEHTTVS